MILAGALLTILTAWTLGRILLRVIGVKLYRLEEDLFALLAGSTCLTGVVFVLSYFHVARKGVFIALCVVSLGVALWRGALRPASEKLPPVSKLWLLVFIVPFAVYGVVYFVNALTPEASPLGSTVYLGGVIRWWYHHGFIRYAGVPQGLGMLFLVAFSIGKHSAAALVHCTFLLALPWLMLCYGRRFGMVRPCILGALFVFLSPIAGITGTSAYQDLAWACVLFGLFYVLQIWNESKDRRFLWLAGVLAVFGCSLAFGEGFSVFRLAIRKLPAMWSLAGEQVQGLYGPWLLLTPIALVAVRWKHGRRLLLAAAICLVPLLLDNSARVLLPAAVFIAPALGLAVENSPGILPLLLVLHSLVSWPRAVATFADENAWRITGIPVEVALWRAREDDYLRSKLPGYGLARAIDEIIPEPARVLMLSRVPPAYTSRRVWFSWWEDGQRATQAILAAHQEMVNPLREISFRFPEQPLRGLRVVSNGSSEAWSVSEMRVYRADAEIERRPSWRVSARPDPMDAARAFDNSEVTAWPAGRAAESGMYLEEDFREAVLADSVMLLATVTGSGAALRVEGLGADGQWRTLAGPYAITTHFTPAGLRRAAADELKSLGFAYVVVPNDTELGLDMKRNAPYWGLTCFREVEGACVCRLD